MSPDPRTRNAHNIPPMNRIPSELLSYIFYLLVHIEQKDGTTLGSMTQRSILQSTCVHWRKVLLDTPSLWSSICVTPDMVTYRDDDDPGVFNTFPVETCIRRSRQHLLDLFIYARPQVSEDSEYEIPPFSAEHMSTALSLLIPHLSRWRSLSIQAEYWGVMHRALQQIEPHIVTLGAPLLESMTLSHCNLMGGYKSTFEPEGMKDPVFLSTYDNTIVRPRLPRLKELTLKGVHVDWSSLASMLAGSQSPLRKLDLSLHCLEVRPSLTEFRDLLMATPYLTKLVLQMTGPHVLQASTSLVNVGPPILLQHLREITIGDYTSFDGQVLLKSFAAPNVKVLTVNDLSLPSLRMGDPGWLLIHIGAGHEGFISHINSLRRGHGPTAGIGTAPQEALFPLLEEVTLHEVRTHHSSVQTFFRGVPNVRRLELRRCCAQVIEALRPYGGIHVPLPQLELLVIRRRNVELDQEMVDTLRDIAEERQRAGCCLPAVRIIGQARWEGVQGYYLRCGTDIVSVFDEEAEDEAESEPSESEMSDEEMELTDGVS